MTATSHSRHSRLHDVGPGRQHRGYPRSAAPAMHATGCSMVCRRHRAAAQPCMQSTALDRYQPPSSIRNSSLVHPSEISPPTRLPRAAPGPTQSVGGVHGRRRRVPLIRNPNPGRLHELELADTLATGLNALLEYALRFTLCALRSTGSSAQGAADNRQICLPRVTGVPAAR